MKNTKPKSKERAPSKPKSKAKAEPITSELHLFNSKATAQQIFDALIEKGRRP